MDRQNKMNTNFRFRTSLRIPAYVNLMINFIFDKFNLINSIFIHKLKSGNCDFEERLMKFRKTFSFW